MGRASQVVQLRSQPSKLREAVVDLVESVLRQIPRMAVVWRLVPEGQERADGGEIESGEL